MALLKLLQSGPLCVNDLVLGVHLPQSKVSMMLKDLRDLKLLNVNVSGKRRIYEINYDELNKYIAEIKNILSDFDVKRPNEIIVRRKVLFSN